MPACRPLHGGSSLTAAAPAHSVRRPRCAPKWLANSSGRRSRRHASTAAALAPKPPIKDLETSFHTPVRTVLHKIAKFAPRVLPSRGPSAAPNTAVFWEEVLDETYSRLNSNAAETPARLVVYGCDEYSGARDLVTALLEEPFSPVTRRDAIRQRWSGVNQDAERTIVYGYSPSEKPASLRTPSNWLQQFPVPVEIRELPVVKSRDVTSSAAYKSLFSSDIPIIVCNPATTPLATIRSDLSLALHHRNAILVIVSSPESAPEFSDYVAKQLPELLSVVFVDPARALSATRTLSAEPGSSVAVQRYQDNFSASGISKLTSLLAEKLAVTSSSGVYALYALTAREQIKACLASCQTILKGASREIDEVHCAKYSLQDQVTELEARVGAEVLGVKSVGEVKKALSRAKQEVKVVMDGLSWWRCVWRVDDVGDTVKTAVDNAWCRELESRLIFHGGRLAVSQEAFAEKTRALLSSYKAPSPFHSPVLENELSQLQTTPSYPITSHALTSPIHARRAQLLYPTNTLHSSAQRITIGMGSSVLAGFSYAWAGWAEKLGVLTGALAPGLELEAAVGTGMFISTFGVWWMVGRWEKAKRRWWRDWDRIGEGLERDLQATVQRVVRENVGVVPLRACDGLDRLAVVRREEVETLKEELSILEDEAHDLDSKSTS